MLCALKDVSAQDDAQSLFVYSEAKIAPLPFWMPQTTEQ